MTDRLTFANQENLLSLLAHNDENGRTVAGLVASEHFEGDYNVIAARLLDYWKRYKQPPKVHTADLFADILEDKSNLKAPTYRRILVNMLRLADSINAPFAISDLQKFIRQQSQKAAIYQAAEVLARGGTDADEEVDRILDDARKIKVESYDTGIALDDVDGIVDYVQSRRETEFPSGIVEFDRLGIGPQRGTALYFLAGKGRGKTWKCINYAKRAMRLRKRVAHVSLENSAEEIRLRYVQAIFAVPKYEGEMAQTRLDIQHDRRTGRSVMQGLSQEMVTPEWALRSPHLRDELEAGFASLRGMLDYLRIKHFASGRLTPRGLETYLDMLNNEGFDPDLVIVDYPDLMKVDLRDPRRSIGDNLVQLRGLASERNFALVAPDQLNREHYERTNARSTGAAEAWLKVHTADTVIVHSQTEAEKRHGLARLFVDHARTERDKFGVLVTQNLSTGQFVLDSHVLPESYYYGELLPSLPGGGEFETPDAAFGDDA